MEMETVYVCSDTHKGRVDKTLGHAKPRVDERRKRHSEALSASWRRVKTTTHIAGINLLCI